jgi:CRISPR-associated protein Csb2
MLAFVCDLLNGRYAATAYNDRNRAEWPPHPARFFSALMATWAEGDTESPSGLVERKALEWLEQLPAPAIHASDAAARTVNTVFVPVNDATVVQPPGRNKLDAVISELAEEADSKRQAKLRKELEKLESKLAADTAKAIAPLAKSQKNDGDAMKVLPEHRTKQPRTFPSVTPHEPRFAFVWPEATPSSDILEALNRLASRLVRVGHSSSMVHCRLIDSAAAVAAATVSLSLWEEDSEWGNTIIRWVAAGQCTRLEEAHARHAGTEPRVLPALPIRYRRGAAVLPSSYPRSVFSDEMICLARCGGPRMPPVSVAGLSKQFRRALMQAADQPVSELISGHKKDKSPSNRPHLAISPLPMVFGPHADGAILGIALVIPRDCDSNDRKALTRAVGVLGRQGGAPTALGEPPVICLNLGESGVLELQLSLTGEDRLFTLRPTTWCRPSRVWVSATPLALDRNPGDLRDSDPAKRNAAFSEAAACVAASLEAIGLQSAGVEIEVSRSCLMPGTAKPRSYPRFPAASDRTQRVLVHARLTFPEPVGGPILLGAGRYQGLGLMAPVDGPEKRGSHAR